MLLIPKKKKRNKQLCIHEYIELLKLFQQICIFPQSINYIRTQRKKMGDLVYVVYAQNMILFN
jgi:hypothetical protein